MLATVSCRQMIKGLSYGHLYIVVVSVVESV